MKNLHKNNFHTDADGNPTGGTSVAPGIQLAWQVGPIDWEKGPTGAILEIMLEICISRLRYYQEAGDGKFRCRQNALAITNIEQALHWLWDRQYDRQTRGVEGTYNP